MHLKTSRKCSHLTRQGQPCQAWAVHGSSPARCAAHGGRAGRTAEMVAVPPRGGPPPPFPGPSDAETLAEVIDDLAAKQAHLSEIIDRYLGEGALSPDDLPQLLALHGLNASRLGRLLRDKQALAGKGDNKLANALETTVSGWLGATLCQDDARHGRTN